MEGFITAGTTNDPRQLDRGVARRQAFLQAAREVFLEQGYEAASVNDVVRRAGGSLATLYAQFGNKEGLFLAVIQDQNERFTREIIPQCVDDLPLEQGLQKLGEQYLRTVVTRENLALFRIIVGEGRKFPELMQRHITSGADKVRATVAAHLTKTLPTIRDPETAASVFMQIMGGRHQYRSLADQSYVVTEAEIVDYVRESVDLFLHGVVPR